MKSKNTRTTISISVFIAILAINFGFAFSTLNSNSHTQQITLINDLRASTEYNTPIIIDDTNPLLDWANRSAEGICTGSGTVGDPYIIRDHIFNTTSTTALHIRHSRKHFRVLNCDFSGMIYGMWLLNTSNGLIKDNHISTALFGFDIINCSQIVFRNNNCSLLGNTGVIVTVSNDLSFYSNIASNNPSYGMQLSNLENGIFEGNTVNDNGNNGFSIFTCDYLTITGNTLNGNQNGIYLNNCNNNTVEDNTVQYNILGGILLVNCEDTFINRNSVAHNGANGIELTNSAIITSIDNEAFNNTENGINVVNSDNNIIYDNVINENIDTGINIDGASDGNLIYRNFFLGNGRHAFDDGSNNDWNSTTIGNYWDNHTSPDLSPNDGIVDNPYTYIGGSAGGIDYLPIAEDGPPSITIISPSDNDLFGTNVPSFNVTITDNFLDKMWYTLDGGLHNYTFTESTGTIDQSAWIAMPDGVITLTFYASDIPENIASAEVNIEKETQEPTIFINSPNMDDIFDVSAPSFIVEISDDNLDSMWYSLDGGITNFLFTTNGTINQTTWSALSEGSVTITFYANDTLANLAFESVNVVKSLSPPEDNFVVIIIIFISIVSGVAIVTVVLLLRRRKAGGEV